MRLAKILISGGSDYVSIAEQQSSVDLERDNMFKHFHGALMLSAWPLHFAQNLSGLSLPRFIQTLFASKANKPYNYIPIIFLYLEGGDN